jgi:hypothetical protein
MRIAAQSSPSMTSPTFLSPGLTPPPHFNVAFFPNTQNKPALPLPTQFIVYSFPLLLGASFPFSSPTLLLLPALAKPQPTPTPPLPHLFFRFSNPPFLVPKDSFPQLLSSLNFSFGKSFLPLSTNSAKFGQIRKKCERSGVRDKRGGDAAHPSAFGQEEDPRVFTRPHPAVTERGNLLALSRHYRRLRRGFFSFFSRDFFYHGQAIKQFVSTPRNKHPSRFSPAQHFYSRCPEGERYYLHNNGEALYFVYCEPSVPNCSQLSQMFVLAL